MRMQTEKLILWLSGKKTLIGSLLLSLLGAFWSLDLLVHSGAPHWLSDQAYVSIGTFVAGLTGAAMRLAIGKSNNGGN